MTKSGISGAFAEVCVGLTDSAPKLRAAVVGPVKRPRTVRQVARGTAGARPPAARVEVASASGRPRCASRSRAGRQARRSLCERTPNLDVLNTVVGARNAVSRP